MEYKKHSDLICPYCFRKAGFHEYNKKGQERYKCKTCGKSYTAIDKDRILNYHEAINDGIMKKKQEEYQVEQVELIKRFEFLKSTLDFIRKKVKRRINTIRISVLP